MTKDNNNDENNNDENNNDENNNMSDSDVVEEDVLPKNNNNNDDDKDNENDKDDDVDSVPTETPQSSDGHYDKFNAELDGLENQGRKAFREGRYHQAFDRFRQGLKGVADVLVLIDKNNDRTDALESELNRNVFRERRRRFAVNAAAACVRIGRWRQGLEACRLVLEELGPSDPAQMIKATYRAGVCARGLGELEKAEEYFRTILDRYDNADDDENGDGGGNVDEATRRDVRRQLKGTTEELKRLRKFAKNMMKGVDEDNRNNHGNDEEEKETKRDDKQELKEEEFSESESFEEEEEEKIENEEPPTPPPVPKILLSEADCVAALDELARRYAKKDVQAEIKKATEDHEYEFSKGFVIRSFRVLSPLQKDIYERYGFGKSEEFSERNFDKEYKAHNRIKTEFERTVRYMSRNNETIAEKARLCHELAFGGAGGLLDL